ncbi:hypothetical protein ABPG74_020138 [Tetrahymena malaccensis]
MSFIILILICFLTKLKIGSAKDSYNPVFFNIQEVKYSQENPDELQLVLPIFYGSLLNCQQIILNDESLCIIKRQSSSTIFCQYPPSIVQRYTEKEKSTKCRAYCFDISLCSTLVKRQDSNVRFLERKERIIQQQNDAFTFTPNSVSPAQASYLFINLISVKSKVKNVFLVSQDNIQNEILILRQQDNNLICIVRENKFGNGNYTVLLYTEDRQSFRSTNFFSVFVMITSVIPNSGNLSGGVILTIEGQNFSLRDKENKVQIGGLGCDVIYSSVTQLQCITQKPSYAQQITISFPYDVVVYSGNQKSITLNSLGKYTYIQTKQPSISLISTKVQGNCQQGVNFIINGENLQSDNQKTILRINGFQVKIDNLNSTQLNFTLGLDKTSQEQNISIHVGNLGQTDTQKFKVPQKLCNSVYLNNNNNKFYLMNNLHSMALIYFDLFLTSYDLAQSKKIYISFDNKTQYYLDPSQHQTIKNLIFAFNRINLDSLYNTITSITVDGVEILEKPLPIEYYPNKTTSVGDEHLFQQLSIVQNDEKTFIIKFTKGYTDIIFQKQKQTQSFQFINNQSDFNILAYGQKFQVQINDFIPQQNFFTVLCQNQSQMYPIFSETDLNPQNIYQFTIPYFQNVKQQIQCSLQLRSCQSKFYQQEFYDIYYQSDIQKNTLIQQSYQFTYSVWSKVQISGVSPQSISYLGGEILTFTGKNIKFPPIGQVSVLIGGVSCQVTNTTETTIQCISGFYYQMNIVEMQVYITINSLIAQFSGSIPAILMRQVDPLPYNKYFQFDDFNSTIYIPSYYEIVMDDFDNNREIYQSVQLDGIWKFISTQSYNITINILNGYGSLIVGSQSSPFDKQTFNLRATQTFHLSQVTAYSNFQNQFINLTSSALKDQNILQLSNNDILSANLNVGDEIVITAPTVGSNYEILKIAKIGDNQIQLNNSLTYDHIIVKDLTDAQDGSRIDLIIYPTVAKINTNIQFDINVDYAYFDLLELQGATFKCNSQNYLKSLGSVMNANNSIESLKYFQLTSNNPQNLDLLENSVLIVQNQTEFNSTFYQFGSVQNNLFFLNQQELTIINLSNTGLNKNIFQSTSVIYQSDYFSGSIISNNQFYNNKNCLDNPNNFKFINNICFSYQDAFTSNQYYCSTTKSSIDTLSNQKLCQSCNIACKTCTGFTQYNCTQLPQNQGLDCNQGYQNLKDNHAQLYCGSCQVYQYYDSKLFNCQKCNQACNTCTGPSEQNCAMIQFSQYLDCASGFVTLQDSNNQYFCGVCKKNQYYSQNDFKCFDCNISCKTCIDSSAACAQLPNNQGLDCSDTFYLIYQYFQLICGKCGSQTYYIPSIQKCRNCDSSCQSCNGPTKYDCIVLSQNLGLDCQPSLFTLKDTQGKLYCGACKYKEYYDPVKYLCRSSQNCYQSCKTCSGPQQQDCYFIPESQNLDCNDGYVIIQDQNRQKYCGKCKAYEYYIPRNFSCQICHYTCRTCTGPSGFECSVLSVSKLLDCNDNGNTLLNSNNQLYCGYCEINEYYDSKQLICQRCHQACSRCTGPTEYDCIIISNYDIKVALCAKNYYTMIDKNNAYYCGTCNKNQFYIQYGCQNCHPACNTCTYDTEYFCSVIQKDSLLDCKDDYYTLKSGSLFCGKCINNQIHDKEQQQCLYCHYSCKTCTGLSEYEFTPTSDGSILDCQSGFFVQKDAQNNYICEMCSKNQFYDQANRICQNCNQACKTCNGPREFDCLLLKDTKLLDCNDGYASIHGYIDQVYQFYCGICEKNQFYDSAKLTCQNCNQACNTCNGPSEYDCLALNTYQLDCSDGYNNIFGSIDQVQKHYCGICEKNKFYDDISFTCLQCHYACKTCYGRYQNNCNLIKESNQLDCSDSFFQFKDSKDNYLCQECPHFCKRKCSELTIQECPPYECSEGYVNQHGFCYKQCFSSYFNFNNLGKCEKCKAGCKDECQNSRCDCDDNYYQLPLGSEQPCGLCPQQCKTCTSDKVCLSCFDAQQDPNQLCLVQKNEENQTDSDQSNSRSTKGQIIAISIGSTLGALLIGFIIKKIIFKIIANKTLVQQAAQTTQNIVKSQFPDEKQHLEIQQIQLKTLNEERIESIL